MARKKNFGRQTVFMMVKKKTITPKNSVLKKKHHPPKYRLSIILLIARSATLKNTIHIISRNAKTLRLLRTPQIRQQHYRRVVVEVCP